MAKTVAEINEKIRKGTVVVVNAEEFAQMATSKSLGTLAEEVDIVTTATFGPMCSSGAVINFGHWSPPIRMEEIRLNGVNAYEGLAAVDTYIGATAESKFDPTYGGAHVIEALIRGDDVRLQAHGKGTDCYPTREVDTWINKETAPHVQALVDAHKALYGEKRVGSPTSSEIAIEKRKAPLIDKWTFSTNGVSIQGRYGIPCVGFGPGAESQAHAPNEITWKADLVKCAAVYAALPALYCENKK